MEEASQLERPKLIGVLGLTREIVVAISCFCLVCNLPSGNAQTPDQIRAKADGGDPEAQFHLGMLYKNGDGVSKNAAEAIHWFRKAAEQNYADAQTNLGFMYVKGEGVPKDSAEGVKWFRKAATQNVPEAQNNLGLMFAKGDGVATDYAEAVRWFRKAAELGFAQAQSNLGVMYVQGHGVPQDYAEGCAWIIVANRNTGGKGEGGVPSFFSQMSPEQQTKAIKRADEISRNLAKK